MDKSKLPGFTRKSSETPWSPTHERKKLSDRAGTVTIQKRGLLVGRSRSWVESDKKKKKAHYKDVPGGTMTNIRAGKDPESGRPVQNKYGGFVAKTPSKKDESEY